MRIVVVAHNISSGGAASACRRLIKALENHKISVTLLSVKDSTDCNKLILRIRSIYGNLCSRLDALICTLLNSNNHHWQSSGYVGIFRASHIKRLNPDIVNVHWIGHSTISVRQLSKINFPIIITVHDEWWLNALSHYDSPHNIQQGNCIQRFLIRQMLNKKKNLLRKSNVKIVVPSNELSSKMRKFLVNKDDSIFVIPNPVSSEEFFPSKRRNQKNNILFYAGGTKDPRKGYDLLLKSLELIKQVCEVRVLGIHSDQFTGANNQVHLHGIPRVESANRMNQLYCEASITIVPSRQEAFGQVASESLMTGTPVLAFEVGGLNDIIENNVNGFLIPKFDTHEMAKVLDRFLVTNGFDREKISTDAKGRFSEEVVVGKYMSIFEFFNLKSI